jgi:hypothetical protein
LTVPPTVNRSVSRRPIATPAAMSMALKVSPVPFGSWTVVSSISPYIMDVTMKPTVPNPNLRA